MNRVTWLGHSTVVIEVDGTRLVTDPALRRRIWHLRRSEAVGASTLGKLDGILVSHAHFDHLDLGSLDMLDSSSPRSSALGYVVSGSVSVYFAGDTDLFDAMTELGPLDLALLPVWGWGARLPAGHLDPLRAAEALRLLRPRAAVPIHWGTFRAPFAPKSGSAPALEFERAAARVAPDVKVRTLEIGETFVLAGDEPG